jgi:DNA-binding IclR family transcriptional regulator
LYIGNMRSANAPVIRPVPAVKRASAILRFLARFNQPVGVAPLAKELGLVPSTCLHILRALTDEGLVSFNPATKRYSLGAGVLALANGFSSRNPFVKVVRQDLDTLSRRHACGFAAMEESGVGHYVVVATSDAHAGMSVRVSVGMRFPKLVSAAGRCVVAFGGGVWSPDELRAAFSQLRWEQAPSFAAWQASVERTRKDGFAIDEGDYIRGVTAVAAPVFNDQGAMLGCIAAVALREQMSGTRLQDLISDTRAAAQETTRKLAGMSAGLPPSINSASGETL